MSLNSAQSFSVELEERSPDDPGLFSTIISILTSLFPQTTATQNPPSSTSGSKVTPVTATPVLTTSKTKFTVAAGPIATTTFKSKPSLTTFIPSPTTFIQTTRTPKLTTSSTINTSSSLSTFSDSTLSDSVTSNSSASTSDSSTSSTSTTASVAGVAVSNTTTSVPQNGVHISIGVISGIAIGAFAVVLVAFWIGRRTMMQKRNLVKEDPTTKVVPFTPSESTQSSSSGLPDYSASHISPTTSFPSPDPKRSPRHIHGSISTTEGPVDDMSSRGAYYGSQESGGWMSDRRAEYAAHEEEESTLPPKYAQLRRLVVHNSESLGQKPTSPYS